MFFNVRRGLRGALFLAVPFVLWGCGDDGSGQKSDVTPPGPITQVMIDIGDGSVTLNWANPPDDFAYAQIRRSDTEPVTDPTTGVVVYEGGDTNTFVDQGLVNGTSYFYGLFAFDGAGNASAVTQIIASLPAPAPVTFADPNLELAIRTTLGIPAGEIMTTDLLRILTLEASGLQISSLEGLQRCVNLRTLKLGNNTLDTPDVETVTLLNNLMTLDVSGNVLTRMPSLATLQFLWNVNVAGNASITSLGTVGAVPSLHVLDISGTGITSLAPIANATGLHSLSLSDTDISDLAPLAGLTHLESLMLSGSKVTDLQPLADMTELTTLYAADNDISDLSGLSDMTSLTNIILSNDQIHDLQPIVDNQGLGVGCRLTIGNNPLLRDAVATQIPALLGRGVEVSNSSGLPTELLGVWTTDSVTMDGTPMAPADFFEWEPTSVTNRLWIFYNDSYLAQELDASGEETSFDSGNVSMDGETMNVEMTNDNGNVVDPPEISFHGTWVMTDGNIVMTQVSDGHTVVLSWKPVP